MMSLGILAFLTYSAIKDHFSTPTVSSSSLPEKTDSPSPADKNEKTKDDLSNDIIRITMKK